MMFRSVGSVRASEGSVPFMFCYGACVSSHAAGCAVLGPYH